MPNIDFTQAIHTLSIELVPALLGIILHEVAHGYVAWRCGDPTAAALGRLTLNPLPHIDPAGLLVFGLTSLSGAFVFGWAKPVPVNTGYFRNPMKSMMLVALAGPVTNFLLALFFGASLFCALKFFPYAQWNNNTAYEFALSVLQAGVVINFGLGWLNLVPIPPLDGSKILSYFLPGGVGLQYMRLERYGFVILLLLLFSGLLGKTLGPLVFGSMRGLYSLLGLQ
ncbi:MAG: Zn-dependent M50 family peptidase [Candidatus Desulfovibrio kirbyi]|uniref:Zn-dependent M50 family peptidase n=1 Tax=Candidatus Desulfovibrio kirbyi TaxID=2696086 RepID=A0A6L2R5Y0_9BACT|nr:MAG: Zn-dependent M50 family peptidase [Candidatus Desulfovibrio kirbyi]